MFAVGLPLLQSVNVHLWDASESIVLSSEAKLAQMQDQNVATAIGEVLDSQRDNIIINVEITGFMNQYAWVFIALIVFILIYIKIREEKELDRGF